MKTLIIDGQVLQTGAWHRGMGKYTLQLMHEITVLNNQEYYVKVLFNKNLPVDEDRLTLVRKLCPGIEQVFAELPVPAQGAPKAAYIQALEVVVAANTETEEAYYLLTSSFTFDFYAAYPAASKKLLLFYDLTPLLFWRDLGGYFPPDLYMERFETVLNADLIFSISECTRNDLIQTFGLDPKSVHNINGGFTKLAKQAKRPKGFTTTGKYILFPTGSMPHKNNELAVTGFHEYRITNNADVKLLITSHFDQKTKELLWANDPTVQFTENVTDEELLWLFQNSEAILFASKYEGLGIPILDAFAAQKPVIASDIPVFKEMSRQAMYYFDPRDAASLSAALKKGLSGDGFSKKFAQYQKVMSKYTWENTGKTFMTYLDNYSFIAPIGQQSPLPKIAVVSLHPGVDSAGRLSEQIYHSLRERYAISYYFDSNGASSSDLDRPTFLDYMGCKVFDIGNFSASTAQKYDAVVYIIDNKAIPSRAAQRAILFPGLLIDATKTPYHTKQTELFASLLIDTYKSRRCLRVSKYNNNPGLLCGAIERKIADTIESNPQKRYNT